jgi:hypothetical protein
MKLAAESVGLLGCSHKQEQVNKQNQCVSDWGIMDETTCIYIGEDGARVLLG